MLSLPGHRWAGSWGASQRESTGEFTLELGTRSGGVGGAHAAGSPQVSPFCLRTMCTAEERGCAALPQGDGSEASTGSRGAEGSPFPPVQLPGAQGQAGLTRRVALLLPLSQAEDSINLRPKLPQPRGGREQIANAQS